MTDNRHLRGSEGQCPKCGSRRVNFVPEAAFNGYGPGMALCPNCNCIWEPFSADQIWDPDDPVCSFRQPCNNCAFRPGSPEQQDAEKWRALIGSLRDGASFHCHKGVPIEAGAEHGFAYPKDRHKLRLCRGYLNALDGLRKRSTCAEATEGVEP